MPFAPCPADNLYFTGIGDSAGNLTLNTNWGVDGSDHVANKTPMLFDDFFSIRVLAERHQLFRLTG